MLKELDEALELCTIDTTLIFILFSPFSDNYNIRSSSAVHSQQSIAPSIILIDPTLYDLLISLKFPQVRIKKNMIRKASETLAPLIVNGFLMVYQHTLSIKPSHVITTHHRYHGAISSARQTILSFPDVFLFSTQPGHL